MPRAVVGVGTPSSTLKVSSVHYVSPTEDNRYQAHEIKALFAGERDRLLAPPLEPTRDVCPGLILWFPGCLKMTIPPKTRDAKRLPQTFP